MMAIKSCWSWESNDPYDHEVVMVRLISFCCHFGVRLGGFWKHFGVMLRSKIVLEAPWTLHSSQTSISPPFPHQNPGHFGGFWKAFGEIFGLILVSFVDIDFTINFYMTLRWFLMDDGKRLYADWVVFRRLTLRYRGGLGEIGHGHHFAEAIWEDFDTPWGLPGATFFRLSLIFQSLPPEATVIFMSELHWRQITTKNDHKIHRNSIQNPLHIHHVCTYMHVWF